MKANDTDLIAYFQDGDTPTGANFESLIQSKRHVWQDYAYIGQALPSTVPAVTDRNVFYLASYAGTYTGFGNLVVYEGELVALKLTVDITTQVAVWSREQVSATAEIYGRNHLHTGGEDGVTIPAAIDLLCNTGAINPTYQWQSKLTTAGVWVNITGETSASLTFDKDNAIWSDGFDVLIRCVVTDGVASVFNSNVISCQKDELTSELN